MRRRLMRYALAALVIAAAILLLKPIPVTVDPIEPRASTRYWTMAGGYRIAFTSVSAPEASRPPLIYLHGGPGGYVHSSVVETLAPLAERGHDLYFYDQSGTGLSDRRKRPKDTTIAGHVLDLEEIVETHIGSGAVILVGHSAGAIIASHYASSHPERVAGLVLSAPATIEPTLHDESGRWLNTDRYPVPEHLDFKPPGSGYARDTSVRRLPVRAIASILIAQLFDARFASDAELDAALNTMAAGFTRHMVCDPSKVQPEEGGGARTVERGAISTPTTTTTIAKRCSAQTSPFWCCTANVTSFPTPPSTNTSTCSPMPDTNGWPAQGMSSGGTIRRATETQSAPSWRRSRAVGDAHPTPALGPPKKI